MAGIWHRLVDMHQLRRAELKESNVQAMHMDDLACQLQRSAQLIGSNQRPSPGHACFTEDIVSSKDTLNLTTIGMPLVHRWALSAVTWLDPSFYHV